MHKMSVATAAGALLVWGKEARSGEGADPAHLEWKPHDLLGDIVTTLVK
jgi:hypothetical protein